VTDSRGRAALLVAVFQVTEQPVPAASTSMRVTPPVKSASAGTPAPSGSFG
jgi:hypothetical protein